MHRIIIGAMLALMPLAMLMARPTVRLFVPPPGQYGIENLWKATVVSDTACNAWFEGFVFEATHGQIFHATTEPFRLTLGAKVYGYRDVTIDRTQTAPGYEAFVTRSGHLPDGNYRFKLVLQPFGVGDSNGFEVKPMGPPRLISPRDGAVLPEGQRYPLFSWTRPMPPPSGPVTYELKLVEVMRGQSPEEAMRANFPWFDQPGITATSFTYPSSARPLTPRKTYAWQVKAMLGRYIIGVSELWEFHSPLPLVPPGHGVDIYFCDGGEAKGSVYHRPAVGPEVKIYTRPTGRIYSFLFAPWDANRLYFVDANQFRIYVKNLSPGAPPESVVHTHTTYVRDIGVDRDGWMYFSEATGAAGDGKIWRLNGDGSASPYYTVSLSRLGGFWSGNFCFDRDGVLYLSTGNEVGASVYRVDVATNTVSKLYTDPAGSIKGITFGQDGLLYYADWRQRIYALDLEAGTRTQVYYNAARQWTSDVAFKPFEPGTTVPGGVTNWVMPWGVGGTMRPAIDSATGLTSYGDVDSAPFGGQLGFRSGSSSAIPTTNLYYYRWEYRLTGGAWQDFDEEVRVFYVKEVPGFLPVFPTLRLGPEDVGGKKLYRFKPHNPPAIPGATTYWPTSGFLGDIYSGFLNTVEKHLAPGKYEVRLSVYDSTGNKKSHGTGFRFVVPVSEGPGGDIVTRLPHATELDAGGFKFMLHVDNRPCSAYVDAPTVSGVAANDTCGFLRYDPLDPSPVHVAFHASHPDGFAWFTFRIVRGIMTCDSSYIVHPYVFSPAAGVYTGDGSGHYQHDFLRSTLLGPCTEAAFSENLYVYAKATTGWGYRISSYDASYVRAFALAVKKE
jgi:hypothetical protein